MVVSASNLSAIIGPGLRRIFGHVVVVRFDPAWLRSYIAARREAGILDASDCPNDGCAHAIGHAGPCRGDDYPGS